MYIPILGFGTDIHKLQFHSHNQIPLFFWYILQNVVFFRNSIISLPIVLLSLQLNLQPLPSVLHYSFRIFQEYHI